ncbi:DUF799 domain-containing protein [Castellaniella defragrans]|uniref:DUF799 domain-containing protein n=1 Tax=Castellaniella defragrans TaxID=75697 RepID=A0A7W9TPX1_CASDE|nr:DUF799 domain-containing protein [Castellaniella defragrans]KAB0620080.1 hypothetical protein F7Q88_06255 [Castellaniella defragrans]MBB6083402.1 hypothetical protein [Castellaniella defragrans]
MTSIRTLKHIGAALLAFTLAGCAANRNQLDYSAFRESRPASILVLPPLNETVEVDASQGVLAQATLPLAESGYYVIPVAVMEETFRQNGLTAPAEIQELPAAKLREIFGADAALYMRVKKYGASYAVLSSSVAVAIEASLIDLRSGAVLWEGRKEVAESSGSGGGLIGMLVNAVVSQIVNTLSDRSYVVAGAASQSLLFAGQPGGILYGPRSPKHELQ